MSSRWSVVSFTGTAVLAGMIRLTRSVLFTSRYKGWEMMNLTEPGVTEDMVQSINLSYNLWV